MLENEKGITWIEAISASTVIFTIVLTFIPLHQLIQSERQQLYEKRQLSHQLFNRLIELSSNRDEIHLLPLTEDVAMGKFTFSEKDGMIQGCMQWDNEKKNEQEWCLYSKLYEK